jgi:SnoaL-like domain
MPEEDVANARRAYEALNEAYRSNDASLFRPILEEFWDPEAVFVPAGVLPESEVVHGRDGVIDFVVGQMQAFEPGTMFIEPLEFIDMGSTIVVPYRFGGRANHTGIEVVFSFVHVITQRRGKTVRLDVYETKEEAFADLGLEDRG